MSKHYIDINCDLGEGNANDESLIKLISSCNIACGGHYGTEESMTLAVQQALKYKIKIGAHPSYPDVENFGRISINISKTSLIASIQKQLYDFDCVLKSNKAVLHHIKPHGALYNDIAKNKDIALIFLEAIITYKKDIKLYAPFNSVLAEEAIKQGFTILYEAFADRNYNEDLSLVSRTLCHAVVTDPKQVAEHLITMVQLKKVTTINSTLVPIEAETYCVHGDTTTAKDILLHLHTVLPNLNIIIQ